MISDTTVLWSANSPTDTKGLFGIKKLGDEIQFFDLVSLAETNAIPHINHQEVDISPNHTRAYVPKFGPLAAGSFYESGEHISVFDLAQQQIVRRISTAPFKSATR